MNRGRVLIVDDEPLVREALGRLLTLSGFDVEAYGDGLAAREALLMRHYDAVLADIGMPRLTGTGLLEWLHARDLDQRVILITGQPDLETAVRAVRSGAYDYIRKPFDPDVLLETVGRAVEDARGVAAARHLDTGTGLPRLSILREMIDHFALERPADPLTAVLLELHGVSSVERGPTLDSILSETARAVQSIDPMVLSVGRLSTNVLAVLLECGSDEEDCRKMAYRIQQAVQGVSWERLGHTPGLSLGLAFHPAPEGSSSDLLARAEQALLEARQGGPGTTRFYHPSIGDRRTRAREVELRLQRAVRRGAFRLVYQPKIDIRANRIAGAEALIRLDDGGEAIGPAQFIPLAEERGLIAAISEWLLGEVAALHERRTKAGRQPLPVAVNVSSIMIGAPYFAERLVGRFEGMGPIKDLLEVEITETALLDTDAHLSECLSRLNRAGVPIALDDFGTGYSSLSHVRQLAVQKLKIDKRFVQGLPGDSRDAAIVRAILELALACGLETIAEGVETREQQDYLLDLGCHQVQGYLHAPPLPERELSQFEEQWANARMF